MPGPRPDWLVLAANDGIPNSRLPVLVYRETELRDAADAQRTFAVHDWRTSWRDGVFSFHHFHSTAHEVLAVVSGSVSLLLGGPGGTELQARTGDVLVLPAGTGHCRIADSGDLLVVGAYPQGMDWDVRRGDPAEAELVRANIAAVPLPVTDPLSGESGPLPTLWAG